MYEPSGLHHASGHHVERQASQNITEFTEKAKATEHTEKASDGASRGSGRLVGVGRLNPVLYCTSSVRRAVGSAVVSYHDFGRTLNTEIEQVVVFDVCPGFGVPVVGFAVVVGCVGVGRFVWEAVVSGVDGVADHAGALGDAVGVGQAFGVGGFHHGANVGFAAFV